MHAARIALALVAFSSASSGAVAVANARLAYEAPEGCPTQPEFVAAVNGRGADLDAVPPADARRVMIVSIRKQGDAFAGAFQVRDERGTTNKRQIHGSSCGEVADALAVVTAIALRPEGQDGPSVSAAPAPAPAAPPPTPAPRADVTPPTQPTPPPEDRLRGSTRVFPPRTESVQVRAGTLRFDLRRSASLYAGASMGLVPSVLLPRYDLSFVAANFVTTPEGAQRIAGLVFDLRISVLGPATYRSPDTTTSASGLSFGINICQSPIYDTKGLVLLFCGEYGGGLLTLATKGLDGGQIQSKNAGFGVVSFGAEVQYNLGLGFHVGAKVGGGLTIGQPTAERADGSRIFASSPWSTYALLGVGLRF